MQDKPATGGLRWAMPELLSKLEHIRLLVQDDGDPGDAVTVLFELRGLLLTVPLPGAALLAEEMQRFCEGLTDGSLVDDGETREALQLALIQLPDYLERVDAGEPDDVLELLPAINDLRASRGAPLANAAELLVPASVLAQAETISAESMAQLVRLAHRIRPHFHRYLVRWFNGEEPREGLLGLGRLFNHLRRYFKDGPLHELFLASEGVIEGLVEGTIPADPPAKALIGRLDRLLKPLVADPPTWPEEIASALLSDLLARLSQAPPGSAVIQELENAYARRLSDDRDASGAPTANERPPLIEAIRRDLAPIITRVQALAEAIAAESGAPPDVAPLPGVLRQLAEPMPMLGLEPLGQRLERCAAAIESVCSNPSSNHRRIDDIAHALGQVDAKLRASGSAAAAEDGGLAQERGFAAATLREARLELRAVCEDLDLERSPAPTMDRLRDCHQTLAGLPEALRATGETSLSLIIEDLVEQINLRYLQTRKLPGEAGLELINRALNGADVHLEDRLTRNEVDARMLAEAAHAVERLTVLLPADEDLEDDSDSSEGSDSLPESESSQSVNLEFLSLFLDEARDELDNIDEQLRCWSDDPNDLVALSSLRSSFYSLKGSGSLVGARLLSSVARCAGAVADALLDGELEVSTTAKCFLTDTASRLPDVIEAESQRGPITIDGLIAQGEALLRTAKRRPKTAAPKTTAGSAQDRNQTDPASSVGSIDTGLTELGLGRREVSDEDRQHPDAANHRTSGESEDAPAADSVATDGDDIHRADADEADLETLLDDDPDLVVVFAEEARALIEALEGHLKAWQKGGFTERAAAGAKRQLHTLKGSARMAELVPIGDLAHALESLFESLHDAAIAANPQLVELVQEVLDLLAEQVEEAEQGRPIALADALIASLETGARVAAGTVVPDDPPKATAVAQAGPDGGAPARTPIADIGILLRSPPGTDEQPRPSPAADATPPPTAPPETTFKASEAMPAPPGPSGTARLRLSGDWLDRTLNQVGEINAYCERLSQQATRMGLKLAQLGDGIAQLRVEFDDRQPDAGAPPPLIEDAATRMTEGLADISSLRGQIDEMRRDHADLLRQQLQLTSGLLDSLQRTRMVRFGQIASRLQRLVRQAAPSTGKQVLLHIDGDAVEVDRNVLDHLIAPLEHLLRNAVVHGIELPAVREAAGKGPIGVIRIEVERGGTGIRISVTDDGAGMDMHKIRSQAVDRGLIHADAEVTDQELLDLTLRPGFTTIDEVTQLAGRGVGLDVVCAEVATLHGELKLLSSPGEGTRIGINLPMPLSLIESLLLSAGGTLYAVPHGTALAVARVARDQLRSDGPATVEFRGEEYQLLPLVQALDPSARPRLPQRHWLPVLLVAENERRAAFQVDSLIGSERAMLKPIGPPLGAIRWLSGGMVLADGRVALVLDLPMLLRTGKAGEAVGASALLDATRRTCIMVVDDSHTVRRVTTRLLARHDMDVVTARDGTDALALLHGHTPDLLLLDVEMPRMDGLELTRRLRESRQWRQLPIIMITSRNDAEHRQRADALGVDRFLSKPFDEAGLLAEITDVLTERTT